MKERKLDGTLIDVETNKILFDQLIMPHSPRVLNDDVYFCESGKGLIYRFSPGNNELIVLKKLQGFARGIDFWGPLMFVGLSKVRDSEIKNRPPIAKEYDETFSGIWIINLEDQSTVGYIKFEGDVSQIYDVAVIPGVNYPELIEPIDKKVKNIFKFPSLNHMEPK